MKDVLEEITRLRLQRKWSEYKLAKHAGLSQSTISTWYRKQQTPTIQTLDKVCNGLGITLSQFFAEGDDPISLTGEQKELLDNWSALTSEQQRIMKDLLEKM
ncbi:helix-turn-helix transcriptional regulator [Clostridium sp. D33t1_170424_F3]|uniref:helix-turn-helix domain-containing protein n=1 Tax=Clostridium sp. D33t1_170424_F3 TaxID=2787099 RepID=UPI0018AC4E1D|nr:helix-turn-helix transcriptional regulator [Clostridium sp. D33t1_170424_F3]